MFRNTLLAGGALLALSLSPAAADYQQGYIAYQQGRYTTAYLEFKESAQGGDAVAQYMLGRLYEEGRGVDRDLVQAYAWYDLAATAGYSDAATARNRLANQLSGTQVQTASDLSAQWRKLGGGTAATPAPAPTPASAPYSVRAVQAALNDLGYPAGTEDGLMGPKTRGAIRAYQIDQGLPASGEASVALYEKLQASLAGGSDPAPSGDSGGPGAELISEVQAELRLRGYSIPSITGELDWSTRQAIRKYQQDANLAVTGEIDDRLVAQLRSGREDPAADYRAQVRSVQQALNNLGYDAGPVDGALGPKTRGAIRAFQVAEGLTVDGNVDDELLEELGVAASAPPNDDDDDASDQGTSEWVRLEIERELVEHNYAAGPVDGVIDNQARAAISAFQRDAGLQANGQASATLLETLRKSEMRNQSYTVSHVVYQIEQDLKTTNYRVGPIDGTLDAETQAGIEAFQRDAGLPVTGRPDQDVRAGLEEGWSGGSQGNAVSLSPQEVWEVEARLRERGYNVGTLDTNASAQTHAAVRQYQQDEGLAVTGNLDDGLLARLQEADAAQPKSWDELTGAEKSMTIMQGLLKAVGPALQKQ